METNITSRYELTVYKFHCLEYLIHNSISKHFSLLMNTRKIFFQLNLGKDNQIGAKQHSYILPLMYM